MIMNASVWVTFGGAPAKDTGFILRREKNNNWLVLSDEQMSKRWPFSLLNDEQMSNWVGVKHLPDKSDTFFFGKKNQGFGEKTICNKLFG